MTKNEKIAWIGFAGVIFAAVIAGLFALLRPDAPGVKTGGNSTVLQNSGTIGDVTVAPNSTIQNFTATNVTLVNGDVFIHGFSDARMQEMALKFGLTTNILRFQLSALGVTNLSEAALNHYIETVAKRNKAVREALALIQPKNDVERGILNRAIEAIDAGDLNTAEGLLKQITALNFRIGAPRLRGIGGEGTWQVTDPQPTNKQDTPVKP